MFMTGGYIAAPVAIAARRHQVPIVIFLPDVEPGSSIRLAIPWLAIHCLHDRWFSSVFVPAEKWLLPAIRSGRIFARRATCFRELKHWPVLI
jgi:UDP-N-acetylglucosamine:LPS N-acetylglucosamine transferase